MKPRTRSLATVLALLLSSPLLAQAPQLDIRMGYWEVTTTVNLSGAAVTDTSKLSAKDKAAAEAMVQAMARPTTDHQCVTREDFNRVMMLDRDADDPCTMVNTTNTRTRLVGTMTCKGDEPMTAVIDLTATSPTAFTGTVKTTGITDGRPLTMNAALSGRFVSATCPKE